MPQPINLALVNPSISPSFSGIECAFGSLPPIASLPLLACETERRAMQSGGRLLSIRVIDRPHIHKGLLQELATADILGLSSWFSNYESAVAIASSTKALNPRAKVIVGGPNAANLGSRILWNRDSIDYVVVGDGEDVLWRLAVGHPPHTIPNLWFRDAYGSPCFSYSEDIDLNSIASFDFRHVDNLDLLRYDSRIPGYSYSPNALPISLVWMRGCPKAINQGRCGYCSIPDQSLRLMRAENAWNQLRHLRDQYGIISFFEGGDDFSCGTFAEDLAQSQARVPGIYLRGYSSLWHLSDPKLDAFRRIGVSELFVGLETADPEINKWSGHVVSHEQAMDAFSLLRKHGISVCMPLLFGLPGESPSSLEQSEVLASELVERFDNIRMVLISIAVPLIGSPWFSQLLEDKFVRAAYGDEALGTTDTPDYGRLSEISIHRFCTVSPSHILATIDHLRHRLTSRVTIGSFGGLAGMFQESGCTAIGNLSSAGDEFSVV